MIMLIIILFIIIFLHGAASAASAVHPQYKYLTTTLKMCPILHCLLFFVCVGWLRRFRFAFKNIFVHLHSTQCNKIKQLTKKIKMLLPLHASPY